VIPIVFQVVNDPVSIGLIESLARPGGNVTGLSNQSAELAGRRLELLREIVPGLRRLAIIANADNPDAASDVRQSEAAAHALRLDIPYREFGARATSYPHSPRSKAVCMRFMPWPTRS
jgi:ABC-type uncharacterized transport system substrate-binding protein